MIISVLAIFFSCTGKSIENQINLVFYSDPKSLDPALATDVRTGKICALLYDNLIKFGKSSELVPAIAKSWTVDKSGKIYTFNLRNDIHFTSGELLTSHHVKSSFERIMSPNTQSHRKWLFKSVVGADVFEIGESNNISGFQAINDTTFIIQLSEPFSPFPGFLAMPAAAIVMIDIDNQIIGTGPWILKEWIHDGHLNFYRNDNYFLGAPMSEYVNIRILPEALPRSAEFITGYLDILEIPESEYLLWAEDPKWNPFIHFNNELNTYYIGLNCNRPPFNDVRVRQAINYAVDVEAIIRSINNGKGIPASGPIPPSLLADNDFPAYGYNLEMARKLLNEAGYENGFEVELWQGSSRELLMITENIQAQLADINIKVTIIRNDWNMYSQAVNQGKPDMYYRSWWADYPDPENFLTPLFESGISTSRWTRYINPELDDIIISLQKETDDDMRLSLSIQANNILHRDAPWLYLWHSQTATIINPALRGWSPSLMFNAEKFLTVWKETG